LIIAHPRKIELTRYNGPYLAYRPGSEATLLNGLTRYAAEIKTDEQSKVADLVKTASDDALRDVCGVDPGQVKRVAELLAQSQKAMIIYGPLAARGEHGQQTVHGLTNLALLTGHYERLAYVGLEANSQGVRDMGVLPAALPGHAKIDDNNARQRLQQLWGGALPTKAGKSYKQMLDEAGKGIKALYIMGANPASERPEWASTLDKVDFLVVQDLFLTETAKLADVVLPAISWAEADGTFTNLERRVQRAPKAVRDPESKAAADWMIIEHLAGLLGSKWGHSNERSVTTEITQAVPAYAGLTWEAIGDQGLQWNADLVRPQPEYRQATQANVSSKADYPLALVSGTVLFDGGSLFRSTAHLHSIAYPSVVGLNPADAQGLGVDNGSEVTVASAHGKVTLAVKVDAQVQPGTAWLPESLPGAPVGALLNGSAVEFVKIQK
jgi:predicted molibdopterin-dependent oxidoreductase YjgC